MSLFLRNSEHEVGRRAQALDHVLGPWLQDVRNDPTLLQSSSVCLRCGMKFVADALGERHSNPKEWCSR